MDFLTPVELRKAIQENRITVIATPPDAPGSVFPNVDAVVEVDGKRRYFGAFYGSLSTIPTHGNEWAWNFLNPQN